MRILATREERRAALADNPRLLDPSTKAGITSVLSLIRAIRKTEQVNLLSAEWALRDISETLEVVLEMIERGERS